MPGKKKKVGKKGKKAGKSSSSKSSGAQIDDPLFPVARVPPPPRHGERLIKLLTTHEVHEKELHGFKVSTRALEQLTPEEVRDLRIVFEVFDISGKGYIGPVELRKAMKSLGFKATKENVRQMINDASSTGKGIVTFNEFLDLVIDQQGDSRDVYSEILHGFNMFDLDKAGKVSIENLKMASKIAGVKFTQADLEEMMQEADVNGDGYVDKDEFVKIMLQTNLF